MNKDTGAVLQDLSLYLKNINITTEKQKLTRANRSKVAEERQNSGNTQPAKKVRCNTCHGTGKQKMNTQARLCTKRATLAEVQVMSIHCGNTR